MKRSVLMVLMFVIVLGASVVATHAADWRAVVDGNGCVWARVFFVNNSAADSNWIIRNCRTAISSSDSAAVTDAELDWDGVVPAGAMMPVWVYGFLQEAYIDVANADGGASTYDGSATLVEEGDGELVITIAVDGTVSVEVQAVTPYGAPSQSGTMPAE